MQLFLEDGSYILTNEGMDCSLPLEGNEQNVRAWYVSPPVIEPVRENGWVGAVAEGGSVNFRSVQFNPHGHGTHTECLGHITPEVHSVNGTIDKQTLSCLRQYLSDIMAHEAFQHITKQPAWRMVVGLDVRQET